MAPDNSTTLALVPHDYCVSLNTMEQFPPPGSDHVGVSDGEDAREHPCNDGGMSSASASDDGASCKSSASFSTYRVRAWFSDWKNIVWADRPTTELVWVYAMIFLGVFLGSIIIFEASTDSVRRRPHNTSIFPILLPHAAGLSFACKWRGTAALPNFAGFFAGEIYSAARNGYSVFHVSLLYLAILSFVEMLEVQIAADLLRRKLCRFGRKDVPTIDKVHQAVQYVVITFVVSLCFETLATLVECTTGLVRWLSFARLWSTRWLGVFVAFITVAPALIHGLAYYPKYARLFKTKKVCECLLLVTSTIVVMGLVIFSLPFTTVIRPLPYLLYPVLIFSVFRFNRIGWALVVAAISFFGAWGSLHYKSSALYYTSGSSQRSSPMLILQIQLYMSVLGLVAISLAGAVREKKQLAKDLHNLNQRLEKAVSKRTQELIKANKELQISQAQAERANLAKSDFLANMSHEIRTIGNRRTCDYGWASYSEDIVSVRRSAGYQSMSEVSRLHPTLRRTPIHGILGLTALLLQTELSSDQLENLLSIKDCADLLLHIINSILDLAKIEAGRLEVETVPFSIRKVVSGTLRMLQIRAKERGLHLLWKVDVDVPPIIAGDPGKLQQCLLNLVGNALKFTHKGSVKVHISLHAGFESSFSHVLSVRKVPVKSPKNSKKTLPARLKSWASWPSSDIKAELVEDSVVGSDVVEMFDTQLTGSYLPSKGPIKKADTIFRADEQQIIEAREVEKKEYVLIEIRDTGIGISKEIVREMFNPFTQADPSTSRLYGGTGLGLSIVQRFVELLGGKIWVESEVGKGSIFSFVVPFPRMDIDEDLKRGWKLQSQASVAVFHPLMSVIDKPVKSLKKIAPQPPPTIGKGRRAHSLNAIMKNLKFTSSQFGEVEPLLQIDRTKSENSNTKQPPPTEITEVDTREGSVTNKSLVDAKKPGPNDETENLSGVSEIRDCQSPQLSNGQNRLGRSSGHINLSQPETVVDVDCVAVGKGYPSHPLQSGADLVDDVGTRYFVEGSSSGPRGRTKVQDGYHDLELGMLYKNVIPASVDSSNEGSRMTKSESSSSVVSLSKAEPALDGASVAIKDLPLQEQQLHTLLPRKKKLHVLLAEDNLINQKVATRQLQKYGHTVTIVGDGVQALNAIQSHHDTFDLVLMDIQMPMMDGLQATQRIREEEVKQGWSRIPILGLTAHAISGYQDTCLSHGMDAYLGKPFEIKQLLKIIQKVI